MVDGSFRLQAQAVCEAIAYMSNNEEALSNFECYLAWHFDKWLEWVNSDMEHFVEEIYHFAHMYDDEEDEG